MITTNRSPIRASAVVARVRFLEAPVSGARRGVLGELYPWRAGIGLVEESEPIPFNLIVPELRFVTNKRYWGLHLKGHALRRLDPPDARTLREALAAGMTLR